MLVVCEVLLLSRLSPTLSNHSRTLATTGLVSFGTLLVIPVRASLYYTLSYTSVISKSQPPAPGFLLALAPTIPYEPLVAFSLRW